MCQQREYISKNLTSKAQGKHTNPPTCIQQDACLVTFPHLSLHEGNIPRTNIKIKQALLTSIGMYKVYLACNRYIRYRVRPTRLAGECIPGNKGYSPSHDIAPTLRAHSRSGKAKENDTTKKHAHTSHAPLLQSRTTSSEPPHGAPYYNCTRSQKRISHQDNNQFITQNMLTPSPRRRSKARNMHECSIEYSIRGAPQNHQNNPALNVACQVDNERDALRTHATFRIDSFSRTKYYILFSKQHPCTKM